MALKPPQPPTRLQTRSISPAPSSTSSRASSHNGKLSPAVQCDPASDEATAAFVKRVLCTNLIQNGVTAKSQVSLSELLPPLTSSNEVDLQLYAYIALIVKECVQTWYGKFTPDQVFIDEIVHIIAHCTRGLEERARKLDLELLLLDTIPSLLDAHINAYRYAYRVAGSDSFTDAGTAYHAIRPHPALNIVATGNDGVAGDKEDVNFRTYRHLLTQGLLAILLPPGDLQNSCLLALVSEVSADLIVGNFLGVRFCESAFFYDSIRKAADIIQPRLGHERWAVDEEEQQKDRLSRFGLLSRTSARHRADEGVTFRQLLLLGLEYIILIFSGLGLIVRTFISASTLPARRQAHMTASLLSSATPDIPSLAASKTPPTPAITAASYIKPLLQYSIWTTIGRLACFNERTPWMTGLLSLLHVGVLGRASGLGSTNSKIDRLIAHHLLELIFPLSKHLPTILLNLRISLFPNNTFPQSTSASPSTSTSPDPALKAAATRRSKRAAAFAILNCIPKPLARLYLAHTPSTPDAKSSKLEDDEEIAESREKEAIEAMITDLEATVLDPFSNEFMNRHLVLSILEKVVVEVVPEMGRDAEVGRSVAELLADRGVDADGEGEDEAMTS